MTGWLLVFVLWTVLGLFFVTETYLAFALNGPAISWRTAVRYELPGWYMWGALSPLIVWLVKHVPLRKDRLAATLIFHAGASALFSVLQLTLKIAFNHAVASPPLPFAESQRFLLQAGSHLNLLPYWAILGAVYGLRYYQRAQQRELDAAQLQVRLTDAQLQILERELRPHFLFNTLNTVSALIAKDPLTAERIVARLGDLLRATLRRSGRQEIALAEELELLERYVDIETTRFGGRLTVALDIDPPTLRARVPSLVLQPLVENAIRHGVGRRVLPGHIAVRTRRDGRHLYVLVQDDGSGLQTPVVEGVGLTNTRARLRQLYGDDHKFDLFNNADGGASVQLRIPFRPATVIHA